MSMSEVDRVAEIVRDSGGRVVGRTRLQKIAYLLTAVGLEHGFHFEYKHFGPFSKGVASAAAQGSLLGQLQESEHSANWGGKYSVYSVPYLNTDMGSAPRHQFAALAASADAIELELAATAVFLAKEGFPDPWDETARRKPDKIAQGRLARAKELLQRLREIDAPIDLPSI